MTLILMTCQLFDDLKFVKMLLKHSTEKPRYKSSHSFFLPIILDTGILRDHCEEKYLENIYANRRREKLMNK